MARVVHLAAAALVVVSVGAGARAQPEFPVALERYFTDTLKLTDGERKTLLAGLPLTKPIDADPSKELAMFGAIWIHAPMSKYVEKINDIENFEKGRSFLVTKRISDPATIDDFAQLVLPPDDIADLKSCRIGDCDFKASAATIERIKKEVDFSRPDAKAQVERSLRAIIVEYINAYRQGGNSELAVYRDRSHPTFVAREFGEIAGRMPELTPSVKAVRRFLLEYPKPAAVPMTSFLYWQDTQFGLKPTIRINHVVIQQDADAVVVATKQLYATHYFWTGLELRVLVPDPSRGPGFWFVNVIHSRSDGLSGFLGFMIRGRIREAGRAGVERSLRAARTALE